jgi:hypothetical protein
MLIALKHAPGFNLNANIQVPCHAKLFGQSLNHTLHDTGKNPLLEAAMSGLIRMIVIGEIGPAHQLAAPTECRSRRSDGLSKVGRGDLS